jgi:geranylgeranyl diphosphate synthase type II
MVKGQDLDMKYSSEPVSQYSKAELTDILEKIHQLKTGSIITWSCLAGLYAHSDLALIKKYGEFVRSFGEKIGLLFQIIDDIKDVTSTKEELGKTPGKDEKAKKITYTKIFGVDHSQVIAQSLYEEIKKDQLELEKYPGDWTLLRETVSLLVI